MKEASDGWGFRLSKTNIGFLFGVAAGMVYAWAAAINDWQIPSLLWFYIGLAVGVVCHELGHALCATCTGKRIRLISIGAGPLLLSKCFGEVRFQWHLLPFGGMVQCYPELRFRRLRTLLFILGGIFGNIAVVASVAFLDLAGLVSPTAHTALITIVIAQIVLVALNLVPYRMPVDGIRIGSDGLQLLSLFLPNNDWIMPQQLYKAQLEQYSGGREVEPIWSPRSARIFYQVFRGDRWTNDEARREMQNALISELNHADLRPEEEMFALNALITCGLVYDDLELRHHLDEWSLRALALGPNNPTLIGSRGAALITLGRYEEGISLLSPLPRVGSGGSFEAKFDTFMNSVFLARAQLALDQRTAADESIAAAKAIAKELSSCPVVPLLMKRMQRDEEATLGS
jgi:Zn-dependent protease